MSDSLAPCYREILASVGEDPEREGLLKTPERAANSFRFLTSGYQIDTANLIRDSLFKSDASDLVVVQDIDLYSLCEHHLLPFIGKAHVGYVPDGNIIGLSKVARIVEAFSRRLQVQEQLAAQIADEIMEHASVAGVGVVIEATHLCMTMRGVQQSNAVMKTNTVRGSLQTSPELRTEFLSLIRS